MQDDGVIVVCILFGLWFAMHVAGSVIRSLMYVDPFMLDPYDAKGNKVYRVVC